MNFIEQANLFCRLRITLYAAQRDVITFSQTQEKEIDFQVMNFIISVWSASGNC
jgi:hypothetical protein